MGANEKMGAALHGPEKDCIKVQRLESHPPHSWDSILGNPDDSVLKVWCPGVELKDDPRYGMRYPSPAAQKAPAPRVKPAPQPLGRVGQTIATVVSLAILAPFVGILWFWAVGVMEGLVR